MGWIVPAVTAGASVIGGLFGNKKSKTQKSLEQQQLELAQEQTAQAREKFNVAKGFLPKIDDYFGQAGQGYRQGGDYYQQLVRGGPGALNALLGPDRSALNKTFNSQVGNLLLQGPRGGGTNAGLANLDANRVGAMLDMILKARPEGIRGLLGTSQALEGLGQNYGNLSLGFAGSSGASLSGAQGGVGSLLANEQVNSQRRSNMWGDIGSGVADLFGALNSKYRWF